MGYIKAALPLERDHGVEIFATFNGSPQEVSEGDSVDLPTSSARPHSEATRLPAEIPLLLWAVAEDSEEQVVTIKCGAFLKGRVTDLRLALALLGLSIGSSAPKNRSLQQQRRQPPPVESTHGPRVRKDRRVLLLWYSRSPLEK